MKFDPEDGMDFGPHCRNCHKGSTSCNTCHASTETGKGFATVLTHVPQSFGTYNAAVDGWTLGTSTVPTGVNVGSKRSVFNTAKVSTAISLDKAGNSFSFSADATLTNVGSMTKWERSVVWAADWRTTSTALAAATTCADDGFSWPHRTLGWKMLKDDLFGLDFDGDPIGPGVNRTFVDNGVADTYDTTMAGFEKATHDIDSVCLDCHNPTVWNATGPSHYDDPANTADDYNDELMLRGLP